MSEYECGKDVVRLDAAVAELSVRIEAIETFLRQYQEDVAAAEAEEAEAAASKKR